MLVITAQIKGCVACELPDSEATVNSGPQVDFDQPIGVDVRACYRLTLGNFSWFRSIDRLAGCSLPIAAGFAPGITRVRWRAEKLNGK